MLRSVHRRARARQIPPGEDARRGIHVGLGVVADAHREELHDFPAEVFLRARPRVRAAVEPDEHRRVFGDVDQDVFEVGQRVVAQHFHLAAHAAGILRRLRRHVARAFGRAKRAGDFRVTRREVVVPEERHLLLQRPVRVQHPEQPPLAGIADVRLRSERTSARRDADVSRLEDFRVDVVFDALVVHQPIDRAVEGQRPERVELVGPRTKPGAPEQMLDLLIEGSTHNLRARRFPRPDQIPATTPPVPSTAPRRDGLRGAAHRGVIAAEAQHSAAFRSRNRQSRASSPALESRSR